MPKSLAQQHYERTLAAKSAAGATPDVRADASQYELMMAQIHAHTMSLSGIQSVERKEAFKREILDEYAPYLAGVIEGDSGLEDEVLTTCLVWRIDAGDIEGGLDLAAYAMKHDLESTDSFKRSIEAIVAELITDRFFHDQQSISLDQLNKLAELLEGRDYPDPIRARLEKALGYALRDEEDFPEALVHLENALRIHDKAGVKKDIAALKKRVSAKEQVVEP